MALDGFVTQQDVQELGILVVAYEGWFEEHLKAKWKHTDATGLPDARKKRPSFSAPGKEEGGGHVDISLHLEPTMDIWDKTGAKVDTSFLLATFYRHRTKHKEVVACSTNNGQLGATHPPCEEIQCEQLPLLPDCQLLDPALKNTEPESRDLDACVAVRIPGSYMLTLTE